MKDSNFDLDLEMDRFLGGNMSPKEQDIFKQKIKQNSDWAQSLEAHQLAKLYIQIIGNEEAKAEMNEIWGEAKQP